MVELLQGDLVSLSKLTLCGGWRNLVAVGVQSRQGLEQTLHWIDTESQSFCTAWAGLTCNDDGRVVTVNLTRMSLSGPLPVQFSQLVFLEELYLDDNFLEGKVLPLAFTAQEMDADHHAVSDHCWNGIVGPLVVCGSVSVRACARACVQMGGRGVCVCEGGWCT